MKTVILCGGQGTRLQEATRGLLPKPMISVGGHPILWHIMKLYGHYGIKDFVLCLGHLAHVIKDYFLNYRARNSDITVDLSRPESLRFHGNTVDLDWRVTLAETGPDAMTGSRLAKVKKYLDGQTFMLTYGDGVADIRIDELLAFHRRHGKLATITGVLPIGRFGKLEIEADKVVSFEEKPLADETGRINGGFMVLEPGVFDYVSEANDCVLEQSPLRNLATDGEMMVYRHNSFWQCMDTPRDLLYLENLWSSKRSPWHVWND